MLFRSPFIAWDAFSFYLQKFLLIGSFAPDYGRTPSALLTTPQLGWTALGGAVISGVIWKYRRREPGIAAAFLVFSMALLPNSGWIPFTFQNLSTVADRYAYLALLGGSLGIAYFLRSLSRPKMLAAGSALIILFGIITSRQVKIWENSETLLNYSLQQNPHSWFALNNMGLYLQRQGQPEKALAYHRQALELNPKALEIEYNYGTALLALHREPELIDHYIKLINKNPRLFGIHLNLALAYDQMGLVEEAISHALQAVQINPNFWEGHYNLAGYFLRQNNREGALTEYQTVLRLNPSSEMARLKVKELEGIKPQ